MSDVSIPQKFFQLYCHEDSRCTLKIVGHENCHEFETVMEAMCAVVKLADGEKPSLTVFSPLGSVIFETQL